MVSGSLQPPWTSRQSVESPIITWWGKPRYSPHSQKPKRVSHTAPANCQELSQPLWVKIPSPPGFPTPPGNQNTPAQTPPHSLNPKQALPEGAASLKEVWVLSTSHRSCNTRPGLSVSKNLRACLKWLTDCIFFPSLPLPYARREKNNNRKKKRKKKKP